jgi:hypothetical protein
VVLILAGFPGYVAIYGTPVLQAGFAAGLVLLLLGGLRGATVSSTDRNKSDAGRLARTCSFRPCCRQASDPGGWSASRDCEGQLAPKALIRGRIG